MPLPHADNAPPLAPLVDVRRHIDARIPFATVSGARGTSVTPECASFAALAAELRKHGETRTGKDGPAVVVSAFREGQGTTRATSGRVGRFRQEALIEGTWLLGLDFDSRPDDPRDVMAPLAEAGLAHIGYSTHSHGRLEYLRAKARKELASRYEGPALDEAVEGYARAPRYRVLVRLARSVTPAEYRALWAWLDRYLGGGSDPACSDPTRLYFTPRRAADDACETPWVTYAPGGVLDPDELPDGADVCALLAQMAAAGRSAPRASLAPAEKERRHAAALALPEGQRTEAERKARRVLEGALSRVQLAPEGGRRKGLFAAACRIGEWAHVLGPSGEAAWRGALLDAARHLPDPGDHARQVDNGIARGRGNPVDVRPVLPVPSGPAALPLAEARERLVHLVRRATTTPGVTAIAADPGVGKTTAVVAEIPALLAEGKRIRLAVPTNRLAREVLATVRRAINDAGDLVSTCGLEPKRTRSNCANLAAVQAGRKAGGAVGAATVCRACDLHPRQSGPGACPFFAEVMLAQGYDVTVTTHALEATRAIGGAEADTAAEDVDAPSPPPDVLIIDEAPRAADAQYTVSERDLCAWRGADDIRVAPDGMRRLRALLASKGREGKTAPSADLADILPPDAVTVRRSPQGRVVSSLGWRLIEAHADEAATGEIPEELATAPEEEALEALEVACQRGWRGCYVARDGTLRLTTPRAPAGPAATTLYLDGTATEASAKALFGPECRFERLRVSLHPDTTTQRVTWSAAKHALPAEPPADDEGTTKKTREKRERIRTLRRYTLTRLAAVVRRYETDKTAWVLHKAWCVDAAVRELLPDAFETGRVVYFRGAEATGSNSLAHCSRIVLADYFAPRAAVEACAENLAWRARGYAASDVDWHGEGEYQLETSERVQAAYRVRPGAKACEIVWLCNREVPLGVDWPEAEDVDADELVFDELGVYPEGRAGGALRLRRAVESAPAGVVVPGNDEAWRRAREAWSHHGGRVAWAASAGVALAYARASDGSTPVVFHARGADPTPEAVASAVVASRGEGSPPLAWVEWNGARVMTGATEDDEGDRLLALLREIPADERATFEALAELAKLSASTVRRRLRPLGVVSLDDLARMRGVVPAGPQEESDGLTRSGGIERVSEHHGGPPMSGDKSTPKPPHYNPHTKPRPPGTRGRYPQSRGVNWRRGVPIGRGVAR